MKRKGATLVIILVFLAGCYYIASNYPSASSSVILKNGVKVTIEVNENMLTRKDPALRKKIIFDYGDRELIHCTNNDQYDYRIYLIQEKKERTWLLEEADGSGKFSCSYSDKKAKFEPFIAENQSKAKPDTLIRIEYTDLEFSVK